MVFFAIKRIKVSLFQSNAPLACCGDGKLPREPLIIIWFTNSVFCLLTSARIKSYQGYCFLRSWNEITWGMHFLIQTKSWSSAWNRLSTVSKLNQVISQRVLRAYFLESLTQKEAAKRAGYSISTFHSLVSNFQP